MGGVLSLCLAGASVSNGNRGVEALGRSVLDGIEATIGEARVSVFDDGWGVRPDQSGRYAALQVEQVGVRVSRRWHRPESWAQIRMAQRFGGLANPVARRLAAADAVLDISGGDSFTDMYGPNRFRTIVAPKQAALRARRPLVLLPQTYGPFRSEASRRTAQRLVQSAALAYARDRASYGRLLELDNGHGNPERLRDGVDVAFALEPRRPPASVADEVDGTTGEVVAGINISGLLHRRSAAGAFGLAGDYIETMTDLVAQLARQGARPMLVPHVHLPGGSGESDRAAIEEVLRRLPAVARRRILVVPAELDASELKWCIARCSWFVGTRMHSAIAALSTGVPAYGYAYSVKTKGVFETCGMGDHVGDAREIAGPPAVEAMLYSFAMRERIAVELRRHIPGVIERSRVQLRSVLSDVEKWRSGPT